MSRGSGLRSHKRRSSQRTSLKMRNVFLHHLLRHDACPIRRGPRTVANVLSLFSNMILLTLLTKGLLTRDAFVKLRIGFARKARIKSLLYVFHSIGAKLVYWKSAIFEASFKIVLIHHTKLAFCKLLALQTRLADCKLAIMVEITKILINSKVSLLLSVLIDATLK